LCDLRYQVYSSFSAHRLESLGGVISAATKSSGCSESARAPVRSLR
jgi:hypothetical protein